MSENDQIECSQCETEIVFEQDCAFTTLGGGICGETDTHIMTRNNQEVEFKFQVAPGLHQPLEDIFDVKVRVTKDEDGVCGDDCGGSAPCSPCSEDSACQITIRYEATRLLDRPYDIMVRRIEQFTETCEGTTLPVTDHEVNFKITGPDVGEVGYTMTNNECSQTQRFTISLVDNTQNNAALSSGEITLTCYPCCKGKKDD